MNVWAFQTMLDSVVNLPLYPITCGRIHNPDFIHNPKCFFELDIVKSAAARLAFNPEYPSIELGRDGNLLTTMEFDQLVLVETSSLCKRDSAVTDEKLADIYESCSRDKLSHYFIF